MSTERTRRPAFQFYPGDHRKDPGIQTCSLEARGLWLEMMCLMHEAEPYGHLMSGDRPASERDLARLAGASPRKVRRLLDELREKNVYSLTDDGVIFSRRMVRDEHNRNARAAGGHKSLQNPNVPRPKAENAGTGRYPSGGPSGYPLPPSLGVSPSSSSSSSPSSSSSENNTPTHVGGGRAGGTTKKRSSRATQLPDDWQPNDRHREIARTERVDLQRAADEFRDWAAAGGVAKKDWDATFNNWLRSPHRERKASRFEQEHVEEFI